MNNQFHQTESQYLFKFLIIPLVALTVLTTFIYRTSGELGLITTVGQIINFISLIVFPLTIFRSCIKAERYLGPVFILLTFLSTVISLIGGCVLLYYAIFSNIVSLFTIQSLILLVYSILCLISMCLMFNIDEFEQKEREFEGIPKFSVEIVVRNEYTEIP
ncbi:hypothetical protein ACKWTF_016482 [Chironomus riparius]